MVQELKPEVRQSIRGIPTLDEAVDELAEAFGFQPHYDFRVGDEVYRITYKQFYSADVQRRIDAVDKSLEDCDKDENGLFLLPLRRNGVLLPDSRDALRLIAIWGEEKYRRFEAAGGSPDLLSIVWERQEMDIAAKRAERERRR